MKKIGNRKFTYKRRMASEARCHNSFMKVLKRDLFQCAICGSNDFVMVHHLNGNLKDNKLSNLLTVCRACHAELHGQTLRFTKPSMNLIMELRLRGMTYQHIGNYLGVSRQRVHQIIKGYQHSSSKWKVAGIEQRLGIVCENKSCKK